MICCTTKHQRTSSDNMYKSGRFQKNVTKTRLSHHLILDNKDLKSSQTFYSNFSTARFGPFEPLESADFDNLVLCARVWSFRLC